MWPLKQFFLCQSISAELQRLITHYSHDKRLSWADFHVTAAEGEGTTFFLENSSTLAPTSQTLEIVARTTGISKFFSRVQLTESPGMKMWPTALNDFDTPGVMKSTNLEMQ